MRATNASCSTLRRSELNGRSSPKSCGIRLRYTRNSRSALRSSAPSALTNSLEPSAATPKYGVEPRASTPARSSCRTARPDRGQSVDHRLDRRSPRRCAADDEDERPAEPADRPGQRRVERHRSLQEADDHEPTDEGPSGPTRAAAQPRRGRGENRGDGGDARRGHVAVARQQSEIRVHVDRVEPWGRPDRSPQPAEDHHGHQPGDRHAGQQPPTPMPQDPRQPAPEQHQAEDARPDDDDVDDPLGDRVEAAQQVRGERHQRVAEQPLDPEHDQHDHCGDDETKDVDRRTLDRPTWAGVAGAIGRRGVRHRPPHVPRAGTTREPQSGTGRRRSSNEPRFGEPVGRPTAPAVAALQHADFHATSCCVHRESGIHPRPGGPEGPPPPQNLDTSLSIER